MLLYYIVYRIDFIMDTEVDILFVLGLNKKKEASQTKHPSSSEAG